MKKSIPVLVLGLLAVAVVAIVAMPKIQEKAKQFGLSPSSPTKVTVPSVPSNQSPAGVPAELPEGIKRVTADAEYDSPGGLDLVGFTLDVDATGTIQAIQVEKKIANPESTKYQQSFANAIPAVVVGKKLAELTDLDVVGRASLTTDAFNQALPALKQQLL